MQMQKKNFLLVHYVLACSVQPNAKIPVTANFLAARDLVPYYYTHTHNHIKLQNYIL